MKRFFERNLPPGYTYNIEFYFVLSAFLWSVIGSLLSFLAAYFNERQSLYIRVGTKLFLDEDRIMPDFISILNKKLLTHFILAALILLFASAIHYAYYYRGSRSIYLMLRLPKKTELHRRSLLIPLLSSLILVLTAAVQLLVFYAVYMACTPQVCLRPDQWQKIWLAFWWQIAWQVIMTCNITLLMTGWMMNCVTGCIMSCITDHKTCHIINRMTVHMTDSVTDRTTSCATSVKGI